MLKRVKNYEEFAQLALGITWERRISTLTSRDPSDTAKKLLKSSNFGSFLKLAINETMTVVAPRCLLGVLERCNNYIERCQQRLLLRMSALKTGLNILLSVRDSIVEEFSNLTSYHKLDSMLLLNKTKQIVTTKILTEYNSVAISIINDIKPALQFSPIPSYILLCEGDLSDMRIRHMKALNENIEFCVDKNHRKLDEDLRTVTDKISLKIEKALLRLAELPDISNNKNAHDVYGKKHFNTKEEKKHYSTTLDHWSHRFFDVDMLIKTKGTSITLKSELNSMCDKVIASTNYVLESQYNDHFQQLNQTITSILRNIQTSINYIKRQSNIKKIENDLKIISAECLGYLGEVNDYSMIIKQYFQHTESASTL
ncbi:unnamed protein product [Didymodactylos carnosus]|uniref:Uncharacterized protein n=1 Tax=Didymodactylos carnosus TaxID=1234261 RepID=A0A815W3K2_9BILA|nr:unnamed protein product [Didymodactylos carnosus]CAF1540196.1 unnamed protein product [Didymodactylos carnosus]CAF3672517.1 unnamed protein product [Didymodactylos carnosus]CAF4400525.1 unnamed protein product [Didymodactylos carnosus]